MEEKEHELMDMDDEDRKKPVVVNEHSRVNTSRPNTMDKGMYERLVAELDSIDRVEEAAAAAMKRHLSDESGIITYATLLSMFLQKYQMHYLRTKARWQGIRRCVQRYYEGEDIVSIAVSQRKSPYLVARSILEDHLSYTYPQSKIFVSIEGIVKCHPSKPTVISKGVAKKMISKLMRNPSLIEDEILREQIEKCIELDLHCSPYFDYIRRFVGDEYEHILQEKLRNRGIPHQSEDDLKVEGMDKTPDVRLLVPVDISKQSVTWIDSKASFGDPLSHEKHTQQQIQQYVDRYGPGMIIYWFGFVEGMETPEGVKLVTDLPTTTIFPSGQSTKKAFHALEAFILALSNDS
eukprot:jgi/Bigna1/76389/fgenesh1_pg.41_\